MKNFMNRIVAGGAMSLLLLAQIGCGPAASVYPTADLTDEQKAAIKAEDQKVADEESYGTYNKKPKKR